MNKAKSNKKQSAYKQMCNKNKVFIPLLMIEKIGDQFW